MKAILDFEKFNVEDNTTFYKYNIDGNFVWFSQHMDTGKIYHVDVSLKMPYCDYADMYVDIDEWTTFYPIEASVRISEHKLKLKDFNKEIQMLEYLKELSIAVMSIFSSDKHYKLYKAGEVEDEQS